MGDVVITFGIIPKRRTPIECESCGDAVEYGRRRTKCRHCGEMVCSYCLHHYHGRVDHHLAPSPGERSGGDKP